MLIAIDGRYIQDHFPGIGRYAFNLIDALARNAPQEKFVVLHNPALANTRFDFAALAGHSNLELRRVDVPTFSAREQWELPRVLSVALPGRTYTFHSPFIIKPYLLRIPSILTVFDVIPLRYPAGISPAARLFYRAVLMLALQTSTRVIVPSVSARDDMVAALNVSREKLAVTLLAADARFKPVPESETRRVRAKYSLPEKFVLYVGINKPHKNLPTLIRAAALANVELVVAGAWDARYGNEWKTSAIRVIRNIDEADLPGLYAGANLFVFPSLYEGFGLPLLEALACGAPCLSSNASSLPEVGGDAVLYFDPHDAEALANSIARVFDDAGLRDELRAKALARAKEFSWERTARETLAVYRSIAPD